MGQTFRNREILICRGSGCNSLEAQAIHNRLEKLIDEHGLTNSVQIKLTGCQGFCQFGPQIIVKPENVLYVRLKIKDLEEIVKEHFIKDNIVERCLYKDPTSGEFIKNKDDIQFYYEQTPIIRKNCGHINPEEIDDYIKQGGYSSLKKVLNQYTPQEVIDEIRKSKLRGRGGAGFLTGQKWQFCHDAKGHPKYLVANGDEGDPGAFMDRSLLEADPHSLIEGMLIAAYAIGANYGYMYVRAEYPLAIERLKIALRQARERGFLGNNIMESGLNFDLELKEGAGAFVCGEETALMASIMGQRGMPRPRPPYPASSGLWNKPTNINNVKTYASIPRIIEKGADWFSSIGTEDASGTIVIALTGKINNSGLVEIPMGTTLRKLIYDIGGGIQDGKQFKGLQTGGPSGGCIPKEYLDTPLDYYHLTSLGSIMGSGGFIILDEDTCMVELARYFISFTQRESCGKCTPCRIGTMRMLDILTKITEGKAELEDLKKLEHIAKMVKATSLCGLGQTAPNPVLTTLKYFRNEYEAHILHKRCPAVFCENLIFYQVNEDLCTGCGLCKKNCPSQCVEGEPKQPHYINSELCLKCGLCYTSCPSKAIEKKTNPIEVVQKF